MSNNPVEIFKGKIVEVTKSGTIFIATQMGDVSRFAHRNYQECLIEFVDGRSISSKQRRMCYALIGAIADWMGQGQSQTTRDLTKEFLKLEFQTNEIITLSNKIFSLSDVSMSVAAAFQNFLIRFCLEYDVPLYRPMLDYVDDIEKYIYSCLIHKKCAICGAPATLHHYNGPVGMGRDREEIIHEGMEALPLCWEPHHMECETIGDKAFGEKYHLPNGVKIDKNICKIYGLKAKKEG